MWCCQCFAWYLSIAIVHGPEWCHSSWSMNWLIVCKFRQRMEFSPVLLLPIANELEVLLHRLLQAAGLAIHQWVNSGWDSVVDVNARADWCSESASNQCPAVGATVAWFRVIVDHIFKNHLHYFQWVNCFLSGLVDHHLSCLIQYDQNSSAFWLGLLLEVRGKVYSNSISPVEQGWEQKCGCILWVTSSFNSMACCSISNVLLYRRV